MNLPTREEAKEALEYYIKYGCPYDKEYATNKIILEAYAQGTLIEARTEGEIVEIITETESCSDTRDWEEEVTLRNQFKTAERCKRNEKRIKEVAHALVGKV